MPMGFLCPMSHRLHCTINPWFRLHLSWAQISLLEIRQMIRDHYLSEFLDLFANFVTMWYLLFHVCKAHLIGYCHLHRSISRTNGQQRSNGIVSPRSMDQSHDFERLRAELQNSLLGKEPSPYIDAKEAEDSLSLYCKPIELYNIIQKRNLKNVSH